MPGGRTKYNSSWGMKDDANNDKIQSWCKAGSSVYSGFCTLCKKEVSVDNSGLTQLIQHSKTQKHKQARNVMMNPGQSKLIFHQEHDMTTTGKPTATLGMTNHSTNVTKAEIIWGLKVASCDMSYRSCDKIGETFHYMFNCPISKDFQLSRTKVSYMISDGFGPYLTKQLIDDVNQSKSPLTIHYDETSTAQVVKQMDIHFRFWSFSQNQVVRRFYTALMFGHAEGEKVASAIINKLEEDKLDLKHILTLSSDGPNVNKTIFRKINQTLKETGSPGMINIGTCNLHVVHNSFSKALAEFGAPIDELAVDIHSFFKYSSARREDFQFMQLESDVETHTFLRHVPSRWLTLGAVVDRIIQQWEPLQKYFLNLSKEDPKNAPKSAAFKRICSRIQQKQTLVELHFLKSVMPLFHSFLELFQTEAPLVHILYDEISRLVSTMMGRYVKPEEIQDKDGKQLKEIKHEDISMQLADKDIVVGESTRSLMKKLECGEQKRLILGIRKFFRTAVKYLLSNFPFHNDFLKSLGCLQPKRRLEPSSCISVRKIAKDMPMIDSDNIALVTDEWKLYQTEQIDENLWKTEDDAGEVKFRRIDHYWRDILSTKNASGTLKYATLKIVVTAALVLPHGNADVERGLSDNKQLVSKDRVNLSDKSIIGNRLAKETVKVHDPDDMRPESVPITKEFITYVRSSHMLYQQRLEEEKTKKEKEQHKRREDKRRVEELEKQRESVSKEKETLHDKTKSLDKKEKKYKEDLTVAEKLLEEGNEKLCKALKEKNFASASVSQALIETAQKKLKEATSKLSEVRNEQKNVESRKRHNLEKSSKLDQTDIKRKRKD